MILDGKKTKETALIRTVEFIQLVSQCRRVSLRFRATCGYGAWNFHAFHNKFFVDFGEWLSVLNQVKQIQLHELKRMNYYFMCHHDSFIEFGMVSLIVFQNVFERHFYAFQIVSRWRSIIIPHVYFCFYGRIVV